MILNYKIRHVFIFFFFVNLFKPFAYNKIGDIMATKDDFKNFAYKHPELVKYIKSGEATWQKFYEIYDIYGDNLDAWKEYIGKTTPTSDYNFKSITDKLKNIDLNSVQEHINTAQKALGIVQELTNKGATSTVKAESVTPRPINKIFED